MTILASRPPHPDVLAALFASESWHEPAHRKGGRREGRVPAAPVAPGREKKHGAGTTGEGGITPAFPAQWFTAYFALSPGTGLVCPRHLRDAKHHRKLGISVGMPGPHDFAVRAISRSSSG